MSEQSKLAAEDGKSLENKFLNRELSWLEFNRRVLHEALDERTPLLERLRFLAIFTSNLDEFYMKRVGGLKRQLAMGVSWRSHDGMTGELLIKKIREMVVPCNTAQADVFVGDICPKLRDHGIYLLEWEELTDKEREYATEYFKNNVFPVLTPLAVDPGHPFPFLSNLSISLGVVLKSPDSEEKMFSRIKVPNVLPAWLQLEADQEAPGAYRFVLMRKVIEHNLDELFAGLEVLDVMPFRVTRNADVERDEEDAEDLLEMIEHELRQRRFAKVVRIEHGENPNPWMVNFLTRELGLTDDDVYEMKGKLDYLSLNQIANIDLPDLKYKPWTPQCPPRLTDQITDIFSIVRERDLFVHHPYESFTDSVERFLRAAADDPKVLAIKTTVYRTGENSPIINTLVKAAEMGKQVICLVELKARFDEERNIQWAQILEKSGVHVVYGLVGLKTHTKTALVVRQEENGVRSYAHIGTGNYHSGTAKLYTDFGLITADPALTSDVVELFHHLTGRSHKQSYRKLLVAPVTMGPRFEEMIKREIEHAKNGRPAFIRAKMNQLEDHGICKKLYKASQAGVKVELFVRGFCTMRPGVPGLSENIEVISVIGRFLEHSRVYYFQNGEEEPGAGEYYIGSADWMYRNLYSRVEAIAPVEDKLAKERMWHILEVMSEDHRQAWVMQPDGSYIQRQATKEMSKIAKQGTHITLMKDTLDRVSME